MKTDPVHWHSNPFRNTIYRFVSTCVFSKISDLPYLSQIIVSEDNGTKTKWLRSDSVNSGNICLTDALLATSSIPVLFPPIVLNGYDRVVHTEFQNTYIDGAKNGLFNKVRKQIKKVVAENGPLDEIFIISPVRFNELALLSDFQFVEVPKSDRIALSNYEEQIDLLAFLSFLFKLERANKSKKLANKIWLCMPDLQTTTKIIDFNNLVTEYRKVAVWLEKNEDQLTVDLIKYNELAVPV